MKIKIAFPTLIFFTVLLLVDRSITNILPFFAAILHESGHIIAMLICGQSVSRITLLPFGIDIKKKPCLSSYKQDLFIYSSGIIVNTLLVILCCFLPATRNVMFFKYANILLIAINILPIRSLDGGQILHSFISLNYNTESAEKIISILSFFCILLLSAVAVWLLFYTAYNFSLLLMCIYLFSGIFLKG